LLLLWMLAPVLTPFVIAGGSYVLHQPSSARLPRRVPRSRCRCALEVAAIVEGWPWAADRPSVQSCRCCGEQIPLFAGTLEREPHAVAG